MEVKVKAGVLRAAASSIDKLMSADFPVRRAYQLTKLLRQVRQELENTEAVRKKLVDKYADQEEGPGTISRVKKENEPQFMEEFTELMETEIDIDIEDVLTLQDLERAGVVISAFDIDRLMEVGLLKE